MICRDYNSVYLCLDFVSRLYNCFFYCGFSKKYDWMAIAVFPLKKFFVGFLLWTKTCVPFIVFTIIVIDLVIITMVELLLVGIFV